MHATAEKLHADSPQPSPRMARMAPANIRHDKTSPTPAMGSAALRRP